jgi:hypothetical protein
MAWHEADQSLLSTASRDGELIPGTILPVPHVRLTTTVIFKQNSSKVTITIHLKFETSLVT